MDDYIQQTYKPPRVMSHCVDSLNIMARNKRPVFDNSNTSFTQLFISLCFKNRTIC